MNIAQSDLGVNVHFWLWHYVNTHLKPPNCQNISFFKRWQRWWSANQVHLIISAWLLLTLLLFLQKKKGCSQFSFKKYVFKGRHHYMYMFCIWICTLFTLCPLCHVAQLTYELCAIPVVWKRSLCIISFVFPTFLSFDANGGLTVPIVSSCFVLMLYFRWH